MMISGSIRALLRPLAQHAARGYVVGADLSDAVRACREWRDRGFATTICAWNSDSGCAADNAQRCLTGIEAVAAEGFDCYVSLKALDLQFSRELVGAVVDCARRHGVRIHFDSMGPETAEPTLSLIATLRKPGDGIGVTIPGCWQRSLDDADRAVALDLYVRVVKGQWVDPAMPDLDARAGFLAVVDRLAGRTRHVAVATHDPDLAGLAIERLSHAGTPCELELIFGLPMRRIVPVAQDLRTTVRIYLPYGHAWLPYAFGQVARNPWIALWVVRDLLSHRGFRRDLAVDDRP